MFSNAIRHICFPCSWEDAAKRFRETPQPRGAKWDPHERPLYNNRSWHYRLEANHDESYEVCLYRTAMVRYDKPADGKFVVWVRGYDSAASWQFLAGMGFCQTTRVYTDVGMRELPLAPYGHNGTEFSAKLVYTRSNNGKVLLTQESWHHPCYTAVMDAADKLFAKKVRAAYTTYANMAALGLESSEPPGVVVGWQHRRGFKSWREFAATSTQHAVNNALAFSRNEPFNDDSTPTLEYEHFHGFATAVVAAWLDRTDENKAPGFAQTSRMLLDAVVREATKNRRKHGRKEFGQFPETLPAWSLLKWG